MIPSTERGASLHDSLPPFSNDQGTNGTNKPEICTIAGQVSTKMEVLVYKIILYCHMNGPGDAVVYDRIYTLVRKSWDTKAKCVKLGSDTFQRVLWLYNAGIDVLTMCQSHYKKIVNL
jgi:hypothetical protein